MKKFAYSNSSTQQGKFSQSLKGCENFSPPGRSARLLVKLYRDRRLTDCLELLEQQGFRGDLAVFILGIVGGEA